MSVTAAVVTVIGFGGSPIGSIWERPQSEKAAGGAYLVKIMGRNDCHTLWKMGANGPEPDMTRMLSGHPEQVGHRHPNRPAHGRVASDQPADAVADVPERH